MLEILGTEKIVIYGNDYKVPKYQLLECLKNEEYGETRLDFELIN